MNFVRSRLSIGNFIGQRCRQVTETWSQRGMCNKPQETKTENPLPPAEAPRADLKIPGNRPSNMDKKILIWAGRFKTVDQIPEFVSFQMINAAKTKIRVRACYLVIVATIVTCVVTIFQGKRAASQIMEKKARWREELEGEMEAAIALSEKPQ